MKPTIQLGAHPDAESLTAFAEQLLSGAEREQILAHMVACSRCREVVFLAHQAIEAEKPASVSPPQESLRPMLRGWFNGLRWAWVPVAALAGLVGFAAIQHLRRGEISPPRMAQNVSPREANPSTTPAKSVDTPPVQQQTQGRQEVKERSAARRRTDRDAEASSTALDQEDKVAQKKDELAKESDLLGAAAPVSAAAPAVLGGAVHGTVTARAKSSASGGPMAQNQVQQQNSQQLQPQNYANEVRPIGTLSDSANKPTPASVPPGGAAETVTVQGGEGGLRPASATPANAPEIATAAQSVALLNMKAARLKSGRSALPNKLGILSEAKAAKTTIAIDTAGSLFRSEDGGKHWQAVNAQWTGRAVLVKVRPTTAVSGGLLQHPSTTFELTTDKQGTWTSDDGKTWTPATPPK
jgi:hypothetical protein